ncbi:hypothetical protein ACHQM5_005220 [Ranunculus cassubicifolius]
MGKTAGAVGPVSENQVYCVPFPGTSDSYFNFVGADRSKMYEHDIVFNGDKFVKVPYGNTENVEILDVKDPHEGPFLESIGQEKWPKGFRKEEGVHTINITGLYSNQDLLKFIGLRPSSSVLKVYIDTDDEANFGSDDDV